MEWNGMEWNVSYVILFILFDDSTVNNNNPTSKPQDVRKGRIPQM